VVSLWPKSAPMQKMKDQKECFDGKIERLWLSVPFLWNCYMGGKYAGKVYANGESGGAQKWELG